MWRFYIKLSYQEKKPFSIDIFQNATIYVNWNFLRWKLHSLLLDTKETPLSTSFDIFFLNIKTKLKQHILQHTEVKFLNAVMVACEKKLSSFDFICQSEAAAESSCCIVAQPRLKTIDYFIYSIVLYYQLKTSFKRSFFNKQPQNAKRIVALQNVSGKEL